MPDTVRTRAALATLLADNTSRAITAQDMRDLLASTFLAADTLPQNQVNGLPITLVSRGSVRRQGVSDGLSIATIPTFALSAPSATTQLTCGMTWTFGSGVASGTYTLTVGAQTTGNITYSATSSTTAANVKTALELLTNVGTGGVQSVTQTGQVVLVVFADNVASSIKGSTLSAANVALVGGTITSSGAALGTLYQVITNPTAGTVDTTHFSWLNGSPIQQDKSFWKKLTVCCANSCSTFAVYAPTVEFYHSGAQFELWHFGSGTGYRIFVDDVPVLNNPVQGISGTAQAGSATSITLASTASTLNGQYDGWDVAITGGTGSGQQQRIINYTGASRIATVQTNWSTAPDNTSTFEIRPPGAPFLIPGPTGNVYTWLVDFGGVRATRKIKIENYAPSLLGIRVGPMDSITKSSPRSGTRTFVIGNSFDEGTGTWGTWQSLGAVLCNELGWDYWQSAQGGTDYLNSGAINAYRLNVKDRLLPPACSWRIQIGLNISGTFQFNFGGQLTTALPYNVQEVGFTISLGSPSAGTYTLSVSDINGTVTSAPIAFNASAATVQSALNLLMLGGSLLNTSVTGSTGGPYTVYFTDQTRILSGDGTGLTGGTFSIPPTILSALAALPNVGAGNVRLTGAFLSFVSVLFLNSLASSSNTLTIVNSTLASNGSAGPSQLCIPWQGDLIPYVPKDGSGNVLPFNIVFANGLNDNGLDIPTVVANAVATWTGLQSMFPMASIYVFGPQSPTATISAGVVNLDAALSVAAQTNLKLLNGKVPYFSTSISASQNLFRTGNGNVGAPNGTGDSDIKTYSDGTHPTVFGHEADGLVRAGIIYHFWNG